VRRGLLLLLLLLLISSVVFTDTQQTHSCDATDHELVDYQTSSNVHHMSGPPKLLCTAAATARHSSR
jgi:hypothetical protein